MRSLTDKCRLEGGACDVRRNDEEVKVGQRIPKNALLPVVDDCCLVIYSLGQQFKYSHKKMFYTTQTLGIRYLA